MAELTPTERLQPSLLDRLTDDHPTNVKESRDKRVLSLQELRASVLRDLSWLLNTGNAESVCDFEPFPEAAHSVLNYGMPELAGNTASSVDAHRLEKIVRQVVQDFEPRILKNSLRVRLRVVEGEMSQNAVSFEIDAELWARPLPLHLYLKTEVDLETGHVTVKDEGGGRR